MQSQIELENNLMNESDKRCHVMATERSVETSPSPYIRELCSSPGSPRDDQKQKTMLMRVKDQLHKQSGYLNKFKDTQRSEASIANGNPC